MCACNLDKLTKWLEWATNEHTSLWVLGIHPVRWWLMLRDAVTHSSPVARHEEGDTDRQNNAYDLQATICCFISKTPCGKRIRESDLIRGVSTSPQQAVSRLHRGNHPLHLSPLPTGLPPRVRDLRSDPRAPRSLQSTPLNTRQRHTCKPSQKEVSHG